MRCNSRESSPTQLTSDEQNTPYPSGHLELEELPKNTTALSYGLQSVPPNLEWGTYLVELPSHPYTFPYRHPWIMLLSVFHPKQNISLPLNFYISPSPRKAVGKNKSPPYLWSHPPIQEPSPKFKASLYSGPHCIILCWRSNKNLFFWSRHLLLINTIKSLPNSLKGVAFYLYNRHPSLCFDPFAAIFFLEGSITEYFYSSGISTQFLSCYNRFLPRDVANLCLISLIAGTLNLTL